VQARGQTVSGTIGIKAAQSKALSGCMKSAQK
jgi:hypothetical protein